MKKKILKTMAALMTVVTIVGTAYIPSDAMTFFYASKGRRNTKVYVEAMFTANMKTNTTDYGLKKNKYVKKVTIRLKEGSYNKSKSTTKGGNLISLTKTNNPLKTSSASWTWYYK